MKHNERKTCSGIIGMISMALLLALVLVLASCGAEGDDEPRVYLEGTDEEEAEDPSFGSNLPEDYDAIRGFPCEWGQSDCSPTVQSLTTQFEQLAAYPDLLGLNKNSIVDDLDSGNSYIRGIQRYSSNEDGNYVDYLIMTRKNTRSGLSGQHLMFGTITSNPVLDEGSRYRTNRTYFVDGYDGYKTIQTTYNQAPPESDKLSGFGLARVTDLATGREGEVREATGFQIVGKIAAIPVVSSFLSAITFMDISSYPWPQVGYLPLTGADDGAYLGFQPGFAAVTKLEDRSYLMVVGSDVNQDYLLFYRSEGRSLVDSTWNQTLVYDTDETDWRKYRNVQFATDKSNLKLYLFAFHRDNGNDYMDLFLVQYNETDGQGSAILTKVGGRQMHCSREGISDQCHFGHATGVYVDPFHNLIVYSSTPDNTGPNSIETNCYERDTTTCITGPSGPESLELAEFRSRSWTYNPPVTTEDHSYIEFWWNPNYESWSMRIDRVDLSHGKYKVNRYYQVFDNFGKKASSMKWWLYGDLDAEVTAYKDGLATDYHETHTWIQGKGAVKDLDGTNIGDDRIQKISW